MLLGLASAYPLRGLYFFLQGAHRPLLWKRAAQFIGEVALVSIAIFGCLLYFTFGAQRSFVAPIMPNTNHDLGSFFTVILILVETAIPVVIVFYTRLHRVQEKLFDDVMELMDVTIQPATARELEWIATEREIHRTYDEEHKMDDRPVWKAVTRPETMNDYPISKYLITLPFNLIPVLGSALFCYVNSMEAGTMLHHYYYQTRKGLSAEDEATMVRHFQTEYRQFGIVSSALSLFPGANVVLVLTSAVGAAMWATDIEKFLHKQ